MCLCLLEHRDRVVSREQLCAEVWPGQFVSQATLEGVIRLVRQAVGDSGRSQSIIQTLHGHGYRFIADVEEFPVADGVSDDMPTVAREESVGPVVSSESSAMPTQVVASHEHGMSLGAQLAGEAAHSCAAANGNGTDGQQEIFPGARAPKQVQGGWRWWCPLLGLLVGFMILVVLGGWAVSWAVRTHGTVTLEKSRIAVLPFIELSPEDDHNYVADGLTENLIAELARIQGLTVIARTSVLKYKGSQKDVETIGRELRVGTIVEGSIRRVDNQVRVSAQLIDVASQSHLWSQEYDRERSDVFGVQTDIAIRVAQWLKGQVTAPDVNNCQRAEPQSTALVKRSGGSN
jgi:TolB-like protein/DNA-binding winged helix-turn-helix (wHTH) protein